MARPSKNTFGEKLQIVLSVLRSDATAVDAYGQEDGLVRLPPRDRNLTR